ncbi:MAG: radical SAM protein, partial [Planctomycetota bacterium]
TIHPDFLEAVRMAKPMGFAQIQVASNGVRFAQSLEFAQAAAEAGLDVVYLQFDGLSDEIYMQTRGRRLLETKLKAIENIGKAGIRVALVPTIVKGVNDHHLGDIVRFAIDNVEVITTISWQPVAITGRIDESKRRQMRFTMADLARCLEEQSGLLDMHRDWYPFSVVAPFVRLTEVVKDEPQLRVSCHPHCGCATYLIVDKQSNKATPLPAFVDIERTMETLDKVAARIENHPWLKNISVLRAMKSVKKHFHEDRAPQGWGFDNFLEFIRYFVEFNEITRDKKHYFSHLKTDRFGILLLAAMHFQDSYNYELDRSRHCVILYAAPNGRLYPFCTWNSGPCHRYAVERAFAKPTYKIAETRTESVAINRSPSKVLRTQR